MKCPCLYGTKSLYSPEWRKLLKNIIINIIGLEVLLIIFFTANGAYASITEPTSPLLQFIGLVPLAVGIFIYLIVKKKWNHYFFELMPKLTMSNLLLSSPLILVLIFILVGSKGLDTSSITDLVYMFIMQIFVVAFIEETIFRGFMLKMLLSKGVKIAVLVSSILFGITHSLQILGGQSIEETSLQIIYAFLVGLVLSLLIVNNQSIIITIAFHGLNNFFNFMGHNESPFLFNYLIIAVLLAYTLFLWRRTNKKSLVRQNHTFVS